MTYYWPEERTEEATRMWLEGKSAGLISKHLGVTRNAVIGKMLRLKVRRAPNVARTGIERPGRRVSKPKPKPQPHEPQWIKLVDLECGMCRYPRGERLQIEYCGAPSGEESWCALHRKVVYVVSRNVPPQIGGEDGARDGESK